jgi:hypothetical protein
MHARSTMKAHLLTVAAFLALASCSGARAGLPPSSYAAGLPALHTSALQPGTLFVAVGDGMLPGYVVFSSPPYTSQGETAPTRSPLAIALTKSGALIVAPDWIDAPLWLIQPPYDVRPKTIATFSWGGGMALDENGNIFLAQKRDLNGRASYLMEYDAPDYAASRRFASSTNQFVTSVEALPGGLLAVGTLINGPHRSLLPGSLNIYRPPFSKSTKIASLRFVAAMTVVPTGLIVAVCPRCDGSTLSSYIALVAPPYTAVTKILARLPKKAIATGIVSSPEGDIFVNEDAVLYHYAPPYAKAERLSNTSGVLGGATATDAEGNLFFGSTVQPVGFTIFRLPVPYTGKPQPLFSTPGIPAGMILSR